MARTAGVQGSGDAMADMYAELSNMEMATVLDGGSTRRVARFGDGEWLPAWIDLDGLWIDDPDDNPGYVTNGDLHRWEVQYPY